MENLNVPNAENLSPAEAKEAIQKIHSEISGNPKKHPYMDAGNPYHSSTVEKMAALHAVAADNQKTVEVKTSVDPETGVTIYEYDNSSPMEKAMAESMQEQAAKQSKLVEEAESEMALLEKLGFQRDEIPQNIRGDQVMLLKAQRLIAEKNVPAALPILIKELQALRDHDTIEILNNFKPTAVFDAEFMEQALEKAVQRIYNLNQEKYTLRKGQKK